MISRLRLHDHVIVLGDICISLEHRMEGTIRRQCKRRSHFAAAVLMVPPEGKYEVNIAPVGLE